MHSAVESRSLYCQGFSQKRLHFSLSSAFVFISVRSLSIFRLSGRSIRIHWNGVEVSILSQQLYKFGKIICNYFQDHKSKALNAQLQCINAAYYQCFSSVGLNASYKSKLLQTILQVGKLNCGELKIPFQTPALNQCHPGFIIPYLMHHCA